jgi:CubicO group peptidase (beta-lactamase class C family)
MLLRYCARLAGRILCAWALLGGQAAAQVPDQTMAETDQTRFQDALRLLDAWLDAQVAFERVPALSAAVVIGQNLVWEKGYGTIDPRAKIAADGKTIYGICSISKLFTAIAVMQLWEAGKFSLDDDIGKRLPQFKIKPIDPDSGPITIRSLLTHSSGLPREAGFPYWSPPDFRFPTGPEVMRRLGTQQAFLPASDRWQYSNLGFAILGELIRNVSGMSYEAYVQSRILDPLKLENTRPYLPQHPNDNRLAPGFGALKRDGSRDRLPRYDTKGMTPAAGFSSTAEDLARFAAWQFRLRQNGGREILKLSTLREMQRAQWTDPDGQFMHALGFGIQWEDNNTVVGHTGVCPGYLTGLSLALNDEVATIAMLNANDNLGAERFTQPMRQLVIKGLHLPAGAPALSAYSGHYASQPWGSELIVAPWGEDLAMLSVPSATPAADMTLYRHMDHDTFRELRHDGTLGETIDFHRDANGNIDGFTSWNQFTPRVKALSPQTNRRGQAGGLSVTE